jgi:glycine dehydrogenase
LAELDRFINAMIAIRGEIAKVESGEWPQDNNPLKHAPHTSTSLLGAEWNRPYSRELAAFPVAALKDVKYWPTIGRVDNVYGDRNLSCSCIPVSDYA